MRPLNKKGIALENLAPIILAIVSIGVLLGIGIYTMATMYDSVKTPYTGTQTLINTSAGTTTLTDASKTSFYLSSVSSVKLNNGTTAPANYSYTTAGVITWGSQIKTDRADQKVNITYVYYYDATNSPEESITTTITGIGTFADWIAIIVVVVAAAIILGIVFTSFRRRPEFAI
jgi:hypothetical protein